MSTTTTTAAAGGETGHQEHVQRLKHLSSMHENLIKNQKEIDNKNEEDPEEIAYRERLRTLLSEDDSDLDEEQGEENLNIQRKQSESENRARNALHRSSSSAVGLSWVADQGKKILVHSLDSVE